jgi:hypothetical protein
MSPPALPLLVVALASATSPTHAPLASWQLPTEASSF